MRLQNYIFEGGRFTPVEFDTVFTEDKVMKMAMLLFRDCKEYVKDLKRTGEVMYRGAKGGDMTKIVPRKDRSPKDMPRDVHEELDSLFKHKFGWNARSEGVFCSGDLGQARGYGDAVFTVWPIGKYKILWNKDVFDLFEKMKDDDIDDQIDTSWAQEEWESEYGENTTGGSWYYDGENTKEHNKDEAEEVAIQWIRNEHDEDEEDEDFDPWNEYSDYNMEWEPDLALDDYIEDYLVDEREKFQEERYDVVDEYKDKYIVDAIRSQVEIMVGCKSYYIISNNYTKDLNRIISKGKIKPINKQLKFAFAKKTRR